MENSSRDAHSAPTRAARWAAFGYQNHVIPDEDPRAALGHLVALCGVMTVEGELGPRDKRPTCSVCAAAARSGWVVVDDWYVA